jgi:high-affinity Fe2+/Pb2+ permease
VRVTVTVFCLVAGGLILFNRSYLKPFDTAAGQLMLLIIGGLFGAALWTLARLGDTAAPQRLVRSAGGGG